MEGYPFVHRERVRFRDLDALGHVNNAVILTYMESARTAFVLENGLAESVTEFPFILARVEVDFRSPVELGETVEVGVRPVRVGRTSFSLEYELRADGRLVAEATSVIVVYNYARAQPVPVPDAWRKLLGG